MRNPQAFATSKGVTPKAGIVAQLAKPKFEDPLYVKNKIFQV